MAVEELVVEGDFNTGDQKPEKKGERKPEVRSEVPEKEPEVEHEIDYKAELEKERARREKAEYTLYKNKKSSKALDTEEDTTPTIRDEVRAALEEERKNSSEDILEEELFTLTDNDDERELIRLKYENAIVKTGFSRKAIREDLEDAKFLANKAKYQRERSELAKTAVSKRTMGNTGMGANQEKVKADEDQSKFFTKGDWEFMKSQKFTKDQIQKIINKRK